MAFMVPQTTVSSDKNELLYSEFAINYSKLPAMFRKGSVLYRTQVRIKKLALGVIRACKHGGCSIEIIMLIYCTVSLNDARV